MRPCSQLPAGSKTTICAGNSTGTTRRPVAIDLGEEQRKLAELRRKRADLAARSAPAERAENRTAWLAS